MPYEPIIPKGHHLGTSHEVDGAVKGHIFEDGTNALKGHADWVWVDDPEPSYSYSYTPEPPRQLTEEERRIAAELAAALVVLTIEGVKWAAPRIARWWKGTAARDIKSTWRKVTTLRRSSKDLAARAPSSSSNARFVASSTGVEIAVAESKITMSSAEWDARYQAMLAAGAFTEQQRRILANAQIDDSTPALDAESTKEQLTPRQFADRIARMLEANPSLLNDETSESVMALLGSGAHKSDAHPVREALQVQLPKARPEAGKDLDDDGLAGAMPLVKSRLVAVSSLGAGPPGVRGRD